MKRKTGFIVLFISIAILLSVNVSPAMSETGRKETECVIFEYDNDIKALEKETKVYTREELLSIFRSAREKQSNMITMQELIDFVCIRYNGYGEPYGIVRIDDGSYAMISFYEANDYRMNSLCMLNPYYAADLFEPYISGNKQMDSSYYNLIKPYQVLGGGTNNEMFYNIPFYDGVFAIAEIDRETKNYYCKLISYEEISECLVALNYVENDFVLSLNIFSRENALGNEYDNTPKTHMQQDTLSESANEHTVFFGRYEQDNNPDNGKETIEWIVLSSNEKESILISKYALYAMSFDRHNADCWEKSQIREWLNGEFYKNAFSDEEKEDILSVEIEHRGNPYFPGEIREATIDNVFLLSAEEAETYFERPELRICTATEYAKSRGMQTGKNDECWWWLRTPGDHSDSTMYVLRTGTISKRGQWNFGYTTYPPSFVGVRPVIVISKVLADQ